MVARELPDLFHIARDGLVAMIDAEAVLVLGRSSATQRIEEPIGSHHVLPGYSEDFPPATQELVSSTEEPSYIVCRRGGQSPGGKRRLEARNPGQLRLRPISAPGTVRHRRDRNLSRSPCSLPEDIRGPPHDLLG